MGRDTSKTCSGAEAGAVGGGAEAKRVGGGGAEGGRWSLRNGRASPRGSGRVTRTRVGKVMSKGFRCGRGRCKRGMAALCVVLVVSLAGAGVSVSPTSAQFPEGPSARVWAKKLASGNVEVGVAVYAAGSDSAALVRANNRLFLYERAVANVGAWYNSEPVVLSSGDDRTLVAIRTRRLASGNLEFGLKVYGYENQNWMPTERYFVYSSARVGRVGYSSPVYLRQHDRECLDGAVPNPAANVGLFKDCETLLAAKDTLKGTSSALSSWSGTNSMSDWQGVDVRSDRVTALWLKRNYLGGSIPPELGNLNNLHTLDLRYNDLDGSIPPELGKLSNLRRLSLHHNSLSGSIPPELGSLNNLEELYLERNNLSGSIPPQLGSLNNLRWLHLSRNSLSGSIPPQLGSLNNLRRLDLAENDLSGSIPPQLGSLNNLRWFYLTENDLAGSIPPQLGSLNNLEWLDLSKNDLSGSIPAQFGSLNSLRRLDLSRNNLNGSIPGQLGNLNNLKWLLLSRNDLSGSIPPQLGNLNNLTFLDLGDNNLTNSIPSSFGSLTSLYELILEENSLSGNIPAELGNLAPNNGGNLVYLYFYTINNVTDAPSVDDNPGLTGCVPNDFDNVWVFRGNLDFCS